MIALCALGLAMAISLWWPNPSEATRLVSPTRRASVEDPDHDRVGLTWREETFFDRPSERQNGSSRIALTQGRALVHGRLLGMRPEHVGSVNVRAAPCPPESRTLPAQPKTQVVFETDGAFTGDVTALLLESSEKLSSQLSVCGSHELYFDGECIIDFGSGVAERLRSGDQLAAEADLHLEPAALIRGTVQKAHQSHSLTQIGFDFQLRIRSSAASTDSTSLEAFWEMVPRRTAMEDRSPGIELALFQRGSSGPLATTMAEGVFGTFQFKVRDEGSFLLACLAEEHPPFVAPVELELASLVENEESYKMPAGSWIEGVAEDHGAFPDGGLVLEARRLPSPGDWPVEWSNHELLWSSGELVRARAICRTGALGVFAFKGLSKGLHRLTIAPKDVSTLFSQEQLEEIAVDVQLPAKNVQLVLPITVIEVRVTRPASNERNEHDRLSEEIVVFDPQSGNELDKFLLDDIGVLQVIARPHQTLRLELHENGVPFATWTGTTPRAGRRIQVQLEGSGP